MPVTPTGPLSLPLYRLREMLAASTAFQTLTGTANASAARARVHYMHTPAPTNGREFSAAEYTASWPMVVIDANGTKRSAIAASPPDTYADGGEIWAMFEAVVAAGATPADVDLDFLNKVGAVVLDLEAGSSVGENLSIRETETGPLIQRQEDRANATPNTIAVEMLIRWGWGA